MSPIGSSFSAMHHELHSRACDAKRRLLKPGRRDVHLHVQPVFFLIDLDGVAQNAMRQRDAGGFHEHRLDLFDRRPARRKVDDEQARSLEAGADVDERVVVQTARDLQPAPGKVDIKFIRLDEDQRVGAASGA